MMALWLLSLRFATPASWTLRGGRRSRSSHAHAAGKRARAAARAPVALVTVWAVRLGGYLAWRNIGKGEDYRYRAMRQKPGRRFALWSLACVRTPGRARVDRLAAGPAALIEPAVHGPSWLAPIGVASWLIGLCFETVGDANSRVRADPSNAGR